MNYPNFILAVWIILFTADFLVEWLLDILNINMTLKNKEAAPEAFAGFIDAEKYRKSIEYTLQKSNFSLFASIQKRIFAILILVFSLTGILDRAISHWDLPGYWHGLLFLTISSAILELAGSPASLYSRFVIEEKFGFNTSGVKTFSSDVLKSALVGLLLIMALLAGLYSALAITGRFWWLSSWGFVTLFQFILTILYPLVIAPIFNKFELLPAGELKDRLETLTQRCGFAVNGVFVMDGTRRSRHSNAYFTGIGKFRRIVIYDTLKDSLTTDEIEAVLAHEIGHWKYGHIRQRLLVSSIVSLVVFAIIGLAIEWPPLFQAFGFSQPSLHGAIFVFAFFAAPLTAFFTPLINIWMRKHEYQADRYAIQQTGGATNLSNALTKLSRDNLSNLTPHPAYSFWHYSHPVLVERLKALLS